MRFVLLSLPIWPCMANLVLCWTCWMCCKSNNDTRSICFSRIWRRHTRKKKCIRHGIVQFWPFRYDQLVGMVHETRFSRLQPIKLQFSVAQQLSVTQQHWILVNVCQWLCAISWLCSITHIRNAREIDERQTSVTAHSETNSIQSVCTAIVLNDLIWSASQWNQQTTNAFSRCKFQILANWPHCW